MTLQQQESTKSRILRILLCLAVSAVLILIDQMTKNWALNNLKDQADIILIRGVFQLHYLENRGMAFGLLQDQQILFAVVTVVIMGFVCWLLWKTPAKKRYFPIHLILVLLIGGAIGNFIDRSFQKYVVDFLYFSLIDFPVFNVADCYVTCAGILAVITVLFVYKDEELMEVYGSAKKKKEDKTHE